MRRTGFSLLELLAVVTILGILAGLILVRFGPALDTAREKACFHNKAEINTAVERFAIEQGRLPSNLAELESANYFPDGIPKCPVSDVDYVLHSVTKRVIGHTGAGKGSGHP